MAIRYPHDEEDAKYLRTLAGQMLVNAVLARGLRTKIACAWGALRYARRSASWWRR